MNINFPLQNSYHEVLINPGIIVVIYVLFSITLLIHLAQWWKLTKICQHTEPNADKIFEGLVKSNDGWPK